MSLLYFASDAANPAVSMSINARVKPRNFAPAAYSQIVFSTPHSC